MPSEKIEIKLPVVPSLDRRSTSNLMRDIRKLEQQIAPVEADFSNIAKKASFNIKSINDLTKATSIYSKHVSKAANDSVKHFEELSTKLKEAANEAAKVKEEYESTEDAGKKAVLLKKIVDLSSGMNKLNREVDNHRKTSHKHLLELKKASDVTQKYRSTLESRAQTTKGDVLKNIVGNLGKFTSKEGLVSGVKGIGSAVGQGVSGHLARGKLAALEADPGGTAAGFASLARTMKMTGAAVAGASLAVGVFYKVVAAASEHQAKLNRTLMNGIGTASDFLDSAKDYHAVVDDIRKASIDSANGLLKFGVNSEEALKIFNTFAIESTGSMVKTSDSLTRMTGNFQTGFEELARNATAYARALGMETTEVASMMGKFISETGYGADQVQGLMENVVTAAATANMPMTKFMGIFRSVLPDVELYQNRLEQLTGTIKLLSKSMSPKDVQNFMNAFAKGFKGTDFRSRLKTVLIAGTTTVNKALNADFDMKAKIMAKNIGAGADEFTRAMEAGPDAMAELIVKTQALTGKQISGTNVSDAMKLAQYKGAQQKGGVLNLATALKGAGIYATYKILAKQGMTLTKGFDGLSEHVQAQLGISDEQRDGIRDMHNAITLQRKEIAASGKTSSKSVNNALKRVILSREKFKGTGKTGLTPEEFASELQTLSDDERAQAYEISNDDKKSNAKVLSLSEEQYNMTASMEDKIGNVVGFFLEKIYQVLQSTLDTIDNLFSWTVGGGGTKATLALADSIKGEYKGEGVADESKRLMVDDVASAVNKAMSAGKKGEDLAKAVGSSGVFGDLVSKIKPLDTLNFAKELKTWLGGDIDGQKVVDFEKAFSEAQKTGKTDDMLAALDTLPGDMNEKIMKLTQKMISSGLVTKESTEKASTRLETKRRPGAAGPAKFKELEENQKNLDVASDFDPTTYYGQTGPSDKTSPAASVQPAVSTNALKSLQKTDTNIEAQSSHQDTIAENAEKQTKQAEATYDAVETTNETLKKGIKIDKPFLKNQYEPVMKSATLDAFRVALAEFAIIQARMQTDSGFARALATSGGEGAGLGLQRLVATKTEDELKKSLESAKGHADGGIVASTGPAWLTAGERVLSRNESGTTSNSNSVHINQITINAPNNWTKQDMVAAVHELYRQH